MHCFAFSHCPSWCWVESGPGGIRMELRTPLGDLRGCPGEKQGDWYQGSVKEIVTSGWTQARFWRKS